MSEPVAIAVFAKAPVPGQVKTRLIPALGPAGAAALAERLAARAVAAALEARIGPVTLWCAPDVAHPVFKAMAAESPLQLATQRGEDLGARMAHAFAATGAPLILIGADCPSIDAARLRAAANRLSTVELVIDPAEDGGYGLIAGRALPPAVFANIAWSTPDVMRQTRARAQALGLTLAEGPLLRDLDTPEDLAFWSRRAPALCENLSPETNR